MKIRRNEASPTLPLPCFELVADNAAGSVTAFRVEFPDRVVSFARDDLRRWTLINGEAQRLIVHIGHDLVVVVVGKALETIHEALDRDRLLTIRCSRHTGAAGPSIKSIDLIERPEAPKA